MKVNEFEIFKFDDNKYTDFKNNGEVFRLNKHPYLDVVLTDHCNANCSFCIADLIHDKLVGDLKIFKTKIRYAIEQMNVNEVLLLGGEPTIARSLIPMISWLKEQKLSKIVMTTNGLRLARSAEYREKVLSAGLTHLNISFMSTVERIQGEITVAKTPLTIYDVEQIYRTARKYGVKLRINNNIFLNNNDSLVSLLHFYRVVNPYCDSIKFSPILPVDTFSVVETKTRWANEHLIPNDKMDKLFNGLQDYFVSLNNLSIIENDLQFGFVKNTMIPLSTPIILNWNFGNHTGMMDKVINHKQINNLKLLTNNELSLSWNRELSEYFINTK